MNEVNRIIQDLEFCDSLFDYILTPDDSGLLLGYIEELQQENKQLKGKLKMTEHNKEQSEIQCRRYRNKRKTLNHRIKRREQQRDRYKSVLDEIREFIENHNRNAGKLYYRYNNRYLLSEIKEDLLQILDKVKE